MKCEVVEDEFLPVFLPGNLTVGSEVIGLGEYAQAVVLLVIAVLGLLGNLLALLACAKVPGLSAATRCCLQSMSTGGLLLSLIVPFLAYKVIKPEWFHRQYACWSWFSAVLFHSSFYTGHTICLLLVHYFTTGCPTCYKIQPWHVYFSCFSVFFISAAIAIIPTFCFELFVSCGSCEFITLWSKTYLLGYCCSCGTAALVVLCVFSYLYYYVKGHVVPSPIYGQKSLQSTLSRKKTVALNSTLVIALTLYYLPLLLFYGTLLFEVLSSWQVRILETVAFVLHVAYPAVGPLVCVGTWNDLRDAGYQLSRCVERPGPATVQRSASQASSKGSVLRLHTSLTGKQVHMPAIPSIQVSDIDKHDKCEKLREKAAGNNSPVLNPGAWYSPGGFDLLSDYPGPAHYRLNKASMDYLSVPESEL